LTRRERLMATLRGEPVDRPAVNLYELGGYIPHYRNSDPFNVYNDPSWTPLLDLAWEQTDLIQLVGLLAGHACPECVSEYVKREEYLENGSKFTRTTVEVAGRSLTSLTRRDPDIDTIWTLEHLLKDTSDLEAYIQLPDEAFTFITDIPAMAAMDEKMGDRGIVMVDTPDPLCVAAGLFSMEDYTIIALTEQELFHRLLVRISEGLYPAVRTVAEGFPGHLWRIYGPEYATEPYLPPYLFEEYVVRYTGHIVDLIRSHSGFARIHCHGRIKKALPYIVAMGTSAIDPVEPPPQGDVELADVRREYGRDLILFGNIEVSDIENMEPAEFRKVVEKSLRNGTIGDGRGFVLMPTSAPYGRTISSTTITNYQTMVELALNFST